MREGVSFSIAHEEDQATLIRPRYLTVRAARRTCEDAVIEFKPGCEARRAGGLPAICPMTHDPPGSFSGM